MPDFLGVPDPSPMMLNWGLNEVLVYLRHLQMRDHARLEVSDVERWTR